MSFDLRDLPDGWIQEFDPTSKHPFWVDTRAKPPRPIWVHPYEDEQFLREHPHIRDKIARGGLARQNSEAPPAYSPRRHSYSGSRGQGSSSNLAPPVTDTRPTSQPSTPGEKGMSGGRRHHQGFFDKLKNKMHQSRPSYGGGYGGGGYGGGGYGYGRPSSQQAYGPSYQQYQPSYAAPAGAPSSSSFRRYAPLVGGMGAGFLLGEMLDGPGLFGGPGFGGGFGGGGFGGGGFGGGGFGGGGFDGGFGGGGFDNGFGGGGFF
ncbi:hypothetical protein EVJ58_g7181 [Rhodofomes roseus]|uniref:WW domain-containing protein n=1 Tax=Rhodofomes roseus TaxID=34475 RepID=A0A4Y9Y6G3_9APHY|nr:hypothetical protein EVJ58_g7181 [Rhodofomes roseus]